MYRTYFTVVSVFAFVATSVSAGEVARWDFNDGSPGWKATHQCEVGAKDGVLKIKSTGKDPQLTAAVKAPAGWLKLTVNARLRGRMRGQLFWTTESNPATSEAASVKFDWNRSNNDFTNHDIFFKCDSPLTSLRFDPADRRVTAEVDWMALAEESPPTPESTPASAIKVLDGFQVERLHSVSPEERGSWVSMTHDPKGRLIVSDQYGKLYRITPGADEASTKVETFDNIEAGMAHGLLYAFDSLYMMVSEGKAERKGLWRVTDTDGDDKFDTVKQLRQLNGGGEHGPHAIIPSPDGKSLYVCAGNHTDPPTFEKSLVPRNYEEDQLLPRMWDAGGHAVGKVAPGGWIAKVNPDGTEWTLVASGFRNEYDIAFNQHGELFTFDADMEWDVGSPWYRPTRVNHVTSGAEFGWRSGTGKWPAWYPDSLGSVIDIGPGSPTGIVFGTGAKFPAKYQHALFISDWSYGVVYAVHMSPDGSSYTGTSERFLSAAPLPVTDLVVNPHDGAFYFTIGGRRTQSGLYRVTHKSSAAITPINLADTNAEQRAIRHKLEKLHHAGAENAVKTAWEYLDHSDRHIRFAARIALEHQPVAEWQQKALDEQNPAKLVTALLSLCRNGDDSLQEPIIQALARAHSSDQSEEQSLAALRVLELALIRMGEPSDELRAGIGDALNQGYPASSKRLNRELSQLLIYLQHEEAAEKTLDLLLAAPSQEEQIQYALWLRSLESGWTTDLRRKYFGWFNQALSLRGGNSFSRFLQNIRKEAVANLSNADKKELGDLLTVKAKPVDPTAELKARSLVKKWSVNELLPIVTANTGARDFENGKRMFAVTACYKCHRFAGTGGIVGPDLTGVGRRFNDQNLLESLVEPSKVISDQYQATTFVLESGKSITGRVANLSGKRIMVIDDMLNPGRMKNINVDEVEEKLLSKTSMMPSGLLDTLDTDEILDLVAYLKSGGDPDHEIYKAAANE